MANGFVNRQKLLAVEALGASLGKTMLYGIAIAIPTAIISGPLLAKFTTRVVRLEAPVLHDPALAIAPPARILSLFIVLLPVLSLATGELGPMIPRRARASVVLPLPDSPTRPRVSPGQIPALTPDRA